MKRVDELEKRVEALEKAAKKPAPRKRSTTFAPVELRSRPRRRARQATPDPEGSGDDLEPRRRRSGLLAVEHDWKRGIGLDGDARAAHELDLRDARGGGRCRSSGTWSGSRAWSRRRRALCRAARRPSPPPARSSSRPPRRGRSSRRSRTSGPRRVSPPTAASTPALFQRANTLTVETMKEALPPSAFEEEFASRAIAPLIPAPGEVGEPGFAVVEGRAACVDRPHAPVAGRLGRPRRTSAAARGSARSRFPCRGRGRRSRRRPAAPSRPFTTSWTVPSPPTTTSWVAPARTASAASSLSCPGRSDMSASPRRPSSAARRASTGHLRPVEPFADAGLTRKTVLTRLRRGRCGPSARPPASRSSSEIRPCPPSKVSLTASRQPACTPRSAATVKSVAASISTASSPRADQRANRPSSGS